MVDTSKLNKDKPTPTPTQPGADATEPQQVEEQVGDAEKTRRLREKYMQEAHASALRKKKAHKKVRKRKFMRVRFGMNMVAPHLKDKDSMNGE